MIILSRLLTALISRNDEDGIRGLAMQRQPTPTLDPRRTGHFLSRADALAHAANNMAALEDLTDLPSNDDDPEKTAATRKSSRDSRLSGELGLKSWAASRVRAFMKCYHCGKRRCIYSMNGDQWKKAKTAFRQKLESVSGRYSCGDLLFDDDHHLSKIVVQKQSLTCNSPIEKGYYNHKDRTIKLKDICIHCGEFSPVDRNFLLTTEALRKQSKTDGYQCYQICVDCLKGGK